MQQTCHCKARDDSTVFGIASRASSKSHSLHVHKLGQTQVLGVQRAGHSAYATSDITGLSTRFKTCRLSEQKRGYWALWLLGVLGSHVLTGTAGRACASRPWNPGTAKRALQACLLEFLAVPVPSVLIPGRLDTGRYDYWEHGILSRCGADREGGRIGMWRVRVRVVRILFKYTRRASHDRAS